MMNLIAQGRGALATSPFEWFLRIDRLYGRQITTKRTPVHVYDLTMDSLRFVSPLAFPVDEGIVLSFEKAFHDRSIVLPGRVTSRREGDNVFYYRASLHHTGRLEPGAIVAVGRMAELQKLYVQTALESYEKQLWFGGMFART